MNGRFAEEDEKFSRQDLKRLEPVIKRRIREGDGVYVGPGGNDNREVWLVKFFNETSKEHEVGKFVYDLEANDLVTVMNPDPDEISTFNRRKKNSRIHFAGLNYTNLSLAVQLTNKKV